MAKGGFSYSRTTTTGLIGSSFFLLFTLTSSPCSHSGSSSLNADSGVAAEYILPLFVLVLVRWDCCDMAVDELCCRGRGRRVGLSVPSTLALSKVDERRLGRCCWSAISGASVWVMGTLTE